MLRREILNTKKSGGQKNGPETIIIGQVVSDEVLCQGGMNLGKHSRKKILTRTWQLMRCGR